MDRPQGDGRATKGQEMSDVCRCGHDRGVHRNDGYCQLLRCTCTKYDPTGIFPASDLDKLRAAVMELRDDVEELEKLSAAEDDGDTGMAFGHIRNRLDEILKGVGK